MTVHFVILESGSVSGWNTLWIDRFLMAFGVYWLYENKLNRTDLDFWDLLVHLELKATLSFVFLLMAIAEDVKLSESNYWMHIYS